jgi:hypothetical protein
VIAEFETVDEFLEHHGTKGMRWGVRKERSSGGNRPSSKTSHRPTVDTALAVGGTVALVFVSRMLFANGNVPVSSLVKAGGITAAALVTRRMLLRHRNTKISQIRGGHSSES